MMLLPQGMPTLPWYFMRLPFGALRPPKPDVLKVPDSGCEVQDREGGMSGFVGLRTWSRGREGMGTAVAMPGRRSGRSPGRSLSVGRIWGAWFGAWPAFVVSGTGRASTGGLLEVLLEAGAVLTLAVTLTVPVTVSVSVTVVVIRMVVVGSGVD